MDMNTQNIHISDLSFSKEKIDKDLKENKNRRLSALFRDIRKTDSVMGIGDWSIMSMIVQEVSKFRKLNNDEISYMCRQSKEYKDNNFSNRRRFVKSLIESIDY